MGAIDGGRRMAGAALLAGALVASALALTPGPAHAQAEVVTWPTFFRTGPGERFVVLEELDRGTPLEVASCADSWCRVLVGRVIGFVDQANIGPQPPPSAFPAAPPSAAGCFDSRRAGYGRGETFRYCPE